jgi:hypothetical protein
MVRMCVQADVVPQSNDRCSVQLAQEGSGIGADLGTFQPFIGHKGPEGE